MRIKTNALKSVRDFFDDELKSVYSSEEIRYYFCLCCECFLGLSKADAVGNLDRRMTESVMLKFSQAVKNLKKHTPIQYILGSCDFLDLSLNVTPDVLIPRPETEELVQKIINENPDFSKTILDICTGSGCIALALKKQLPNATVCGFDISDSAITIAKKNAEKNQLNVEFFVADIFTYDTEKTFDIIVSNPPYVRHSEKSQMAENVLSYEPHSALFVDDNDPLIFYSAIATFAKKHLNTNGKLYLEVNESLGNETAKLLENAGFSNVETHTDFRNKTRFITAIIKL
jgi:release factor glutamine methyltransferase